MGHRQDREARLRAFVDHRGPEVFRSVAYTQEIWKEDPFDVDTIHAGARQAFLRMARRAGSDPDAVGRVLLVLGPAGCGKTHLMRAFRNALHREEEGWFGYMQMTSEASSYERYLLVGVIDSLNHPYDRPRATTSGLRRLSDALVGLLPRSAHALLEQMTEEDELALVPPMAFDLADRLIEANPDLAEVDPDLLRTLVLVQSTSPLIRSALLKLLRCERLSPHDCERIGFLESRTDPEDALRILRDLGRVMALTEEGAFVVCIDQLEDLYDDDENAAQRFRRAMETVVRFSQQVPNAIVVVACLRDYYHALERDLKKSTKDRILQDPLPQNLDGTLNLEQVRAVATARLRHLYEELDTPFDAAHPVDPFHESDMEALQGLMVRAALHQCRQAQEGSAQTGRRPRIATDDDVPEDDAAPATVHVMAKNVSAAGIADLERAWNDFRVRESAQVPDESADRAALLARGLERVTHEFAAELQVTATSKDIYVSFETHRNGKVFEQGLIGVCEKSPRGGGLYRQVTKTLNQATMDGRVPIVARSTEYPTSPQALATQRLGEVIQEGGRRVVIAHEVWRDLALLPRFTAMHAQHADFAEWLTRERPLSRLPAIQEFLDLEARSAQLARHGRREAIESFEVVIEDDPDVREFEGPIVAEGRAIDYDGYEEEGEEDEVDGPGSAEPLPAPEDLLLGEVASGDRAPFRLPGAALTHPMVILGEARTPAMPLALNLLETLLEKGVPVLCLDRRGDLASYATWESWTSPLDGVANILRRTKLRQGLEFTLYTPGAPAGRPLVIPPVPTMLVDLPRIERRKRAQAAAAAIGGLLDYRLDGVGRDATRLAILTQAMLVQAQRAPGRPVSLDDLVMRIDGEDPALLHALGKFERKNLEALSEHLEMMGMGAAPLFSTDGESPHFEEWFGRRRRGDRTPLTIVHLGLLGDPDRIHYWVARFLQDLVHHARQHPQDDLQGMVFIDDAELTLPAGRSFPAKAALQSALRRLGGAGLGLVLLSQAPRDLDIGALEDVPTFFLGRIEESRALDGIRPLLEERGFDWVSRLPVLDPKVCLACCERQVTPLRVPPNLVETHRPGRNALLEAASRTRRLT